MFILISRIEIRQFNQSCRYNGNQWLWDKTNNLMDVRDNWVYPPKWPLQRTLFADKPNYICVCIYTLV